MGATNSTQRDVILNTPSRGALRGISQTDNTTGQLVCRRYTRIPYALPPTGSRRWRRPVAFPADFSFNDCKGEPGIYTEFGHVCPQTSYGDGVGLLHNELAAEEAEKMQSEDCLYLNIWVPEGKEPEGGWAVQIYLHVSANYRVTHLSLEPLRLSRFIRVGRRKRLSVPTGNFGFWDQRMAIEWVHANISLFGGNPENITVGGLSAGAHSSIFQLYYDTYLPAAERLIKRVYLFSNAIGIQYKSATAQECQTQFSELLSAPGIPLSLPASHRLAALRAISDSDLVSKISNLKQHTFRPTTDGEFIPQNFLKSIHDGSFTTLLAKHAVGIFFGEVANEAKLYQLVNPSTSLPTLEGNLKQYYSPAVTATLLASYPLPSASAAEQEWAEIKGRILADCQVHAVIRGFADSLLNPPPGQTPLPITSVHRYRIDWRAKSLDKWLDPAVLSCHASDIPIWWLSGRRAGFDEKDEETVAELLRPFYAFLKGEKVEWGVRSKEEVRQVLPDGTVVVTRDEGWEDGLRIWGVMAKAQGL